MYEHDYDGSAAKTGKRHLGKTRWTREEVHKSFQIYMNSLLVGVNQLLFAGRHSLSVYNAFNKHSFSFIQDEKLKKLVELHGSEDWKLVASLLSVSTAWRTDMRCFYLYFSAASLHVS